MSVASIKRMTESHIPEILEIEKISFGMPWSQNGFLRVLEDPRAIVYAAEVDGEVAGYICASETGDEAEILKLAVAPRFRRRGIARELNARCMEELRARGTKNVYLEVRKSNLEAIRLYESFGFRADRIRRAYYVSPVEDALVMKLALSG